MEACKNIYIYFNYYYNGVVNKVGTIRKNKNKNVRNKKKKKKQLNKEFKMSNKLSKLKSSKYYKIKF